MRYYFSRFIDLVNYVCKPFRFMDYVLEYIHVNYIPESWCDQGDMRPADPEVN